MSQEYVIRPVSAAETRPLRKEVLRPHQRLDQVGFAGDEAPGAAHFGAFVGDEMVATATVHPDRRAERSEARSCREPVASGLPVEKDSWRLRGMATRDGFRGQGMGGALVA